jgi:hypothetical protein
MFTLPFTRGQFFDVFTDYNLTVWPLQFVLLGLAVLFAFAVAARPGGVGRWGWWLLTGLWLWAGFVYHIAFFSAVNPAAFLFGALFVVQAVLLARAGRSGRSFRLPAWRPAAVIGGALMIYALVLYPVLGQLAGHGYPANPTFGAPCPLTIFTLGMLLWTTGGTPLHLVVLPAVWSVVGGSAALQLGVLEDLALPLGAVLVLVVGVLQKRIPGAVEAREPGETAAAAVRSD